MLPEPLNGPIYNPAWAFLLEKALLLLWDGDETQLGVTNYDHTYICCCVMDCGPQELTEPLCQEITRRLGGLDAYSIKNFALWLQEASGVTRVDIQKLRREWCLQMIQEFSDEKNCFREAV